MCPTRHMQTDTPYCRNGSEEYFMCLCPEPFDTWEKSCSNTHIVKIDPQRALFTVIYTRVWIFEFKNDIVFE